MSKDNCRAALEAERERICAMDRQLAKHIWSLGRDKASTYLLGKLAENIRRYDEISERLEGKRSCIYAKPTPEPPPSQSSYQLDK